MSNKEQGGGALGVKFDAKAFPFEEPKGKQLAFASVTINDCFAVTGIKVMEGDKGPFVAMPSTKDREGNFRDICFPTTKELRAELSASVMEAYNAAIEKGLSDRAVDKGQEKPSAVGKLQEAAKESKARAKEPKPDKAAPKKSEPAL